MTYRTLGPPSDPAHLSFSVHPHIGHHFSSTVSGGGSRFFILVSFGRAQKREANYNRRDSKRRCPIQTVNVPGFD